MNPISQRVPQHDRRDTSPVTPGCINCSSSSFKHQWFKLVSALEATLKSGYEDFKRIQISKTSGREGI
ncbi:hypothetical protein AALP_AA5G044300 [Arabis alpina]|uniref:Uncharacterized protein n=1 Tax=Arabis alpina TaxID=50452 RepID=A0A087GUW7_ARAAL|nr:hypothetical protein AALP_AA5G044300 [Arabis alpina]